MSRAAPSLAAAQASRFRFMHSLVHNPSNIADAWWVHLHEVQMVFFLLYRQASRHTMPSQVAR